MNGIVINPHQSNNLLNLYRIVHLTALVKIYLGSRTSAGFIRLYLSRDMQDLVTIQFGNVFHYSKASRTFMDIGTLRHMIIVALRCCFLYVYWKIT